MIKCVLLLCCFCLGSAAALAQSRGVDPPPPPPSELKRSKTPKQKAEKKAADELYAECLEKMIESGTPSNAYMRACLGLDAKPKSKPKSQAKPRKPRRRNRSSKPKNNNVASSPADAVTQGFVTRLDVLIPKLNLCLEQLSSGLKSFGLAPAGSLTLEMSFAKQEVNQVKFVKTTVNDARFLDCLKQSLYRASLLEADQSGKITTATVEWEITGKGSKKALTVKGNPTFK